jgi:chemotaxis signal transduction protein
MADTAIAEATRTARVLVFHVDDGAFCIHLDWVEAVYQREDAPIHTIKGEHATGKFLIHRGRPALLVDLREAFGLTELLGTTDRAALMVVRAGSFLLALQVDSCVGVRDLDLRTKVPVATHLVRDGGLSVGHMVELDGRLHGLLEPSRILSGAMRGQIEPMLAEAQAFGDRQEKLTELSAELRRDPSVTGLKNFARLCRRNGRTRAAAAARLVVKMVQEGELHVDAPVVGDLTADGLVRDIVALAAGRQTGEIEVQLSATEAAKIFFDGGRVADACVPGEWGRGAFKKILAARDGSYRFVPTTQAVHPQRIKDATLWVLVEAVEQLSEEKRGRSSRA